MFHHIRNKQTLIIAPLVLVVAGIIVGVFFLPSSKSKAVLEQHFDYGTRPIVPARLVIPKLGIDANVQHVGKNAAGNMAVPKNYTDVAWYEPGYKPGEQGNAAIDGHVDNSLGLHGIFWNLHDIQVGDDIFVKDENGKTLRFVVKAKNVYEYYSAPLAEIFGPTDEKILNLITCTGEWDNSTKNYRERLIVHTELAP